MKYYQIQWPKNIKIKKQVAQSILGELLVLILYVYLNKPIDGLIFLCFIYNY